MADISGTPPVTASIVAKPTAAPAAPKQEKTSKPAHHAPSDHAKIKHQPKGESSTQDLVAKAKELAGQGVDFVKEHPAETAAVVAAAALTGAAIVNHDQVEEAGKKALSAAAEKGKAALQTVSDHPIATAAVAAGATYVASAHGEEIKTALKPENLKRKLGEVKAYAKEHPGKTAAVVAGVVGLSYAATHPEKLKALAETVMGKIADHPYKAAVAIGLATYLLNTKRDSIENALQPENIEKTIKDAEEWAKANPGKASLVAAGVTYLGAKELRQVLDPSVSSESGITPFDRDNNEKFEASRNTHLALTYLGFAGVGAAIAMGTGKFKPRGKEVSGEAAAVTGIASFFTALFSGLSNPGGLRASNYNDPELTAHAHVETIKAYREILYRDPTPEELKEGEDWGDYDAFRAKLQTSPEGIAAYNKHH